MFKSKKNMTLFKNAMIFSLLFIILSCAEDCKFNSISTESLPDGTVGTEYYFRIELETSCSAPYRKIEVKNGDLPPGITLDTSGEFTGIPTQAGTYTFTITARVCFGSNGFEYIDCRDKTKEFTIKIN
ncbi:hypothetical protein D9V86_01750 [Bacteroidetes/Chlorobi group bacterium ChocPot_Mid]|jgi:hypothetical protein|nr:MAG: hypothetical protein D9V86_01750 [Bacteroidetes/Chlorobi group bacterium ChocPot_Mid]